VVVVYNSWWCVIFLFSYYWSKNHKTVLRLIGRYIIIHCFIISWQDFFSLPCSSRIHLNSRATYTVFFSSVAPPHFSINNCTSVQWKGKLNATNICVTANHGYNPLVVVSTSSSWHFTGFLTWIILQVECHNWIKIYVPFRNNCVHSRF